MQNILQGELLVFHCWHKTPKKITLKEKICFGTQFWKKGERQKGNKKDPPVKPAWELNKPANQMGDLQSSSLPPLLYTQSPNLTPTAVADHFL